MKATISSPETATKLIAAALKWLDVEQPDTAILTHHGISCGVELLRCHVRLAPVAFNGLPVFIFIIAKPVYSPNHVIVNPFMSREITAIMRILRSAGVDVVGAWNGSGYTTASFSHGKLCGTTLRAAIDRYQKGCPTHPQKGVFCRCNWLTNGYDTFRLPKKWS